MVLLEFKGAKADLGSLSVSIGGQGRVIELAETAAAGDRGMKRAVALASFGLWLREEISDEAFDASLKLAETGGAGTLHPEMKRTMAEARALRKAGR